MCGPAGLPLFCLAPHGVFPASRITSRAVSSYLAFSPLPALCYQRTGGTFSVTLSVATILQSQRPRVLRGMPPYGVRTFLWLALRLTSDRLPSVGLYHNLRAWESWEAAQDADSPPGSALVSSAWRRRPVFANFLMTFKDCFGETPKPALGTSALPGPTVATLSVIPCP